MGAACCHVSDPREAPRLLPVCLSRAGLKAWLPARSRPRRPSPSSASGLHGRLAARVRRPGQPTSVAAAAGQLRRLPVRGERFACGRTVAAANGGRDATASALARAPSPAECGLFAWGP